MKSVKSRHSVESADHSLLKKLTYAVLQAPQVRKCLSVNIFHSPTLKKMHLQLFRLLVLCYLLCTASSFSLTFIQEVLILLGGRAGRQDRHSAQMSLSWKMWRLEGFYRSAHGATSFLFHSHNCSFFSITSLPCLDCSKLTARN